MPFDKVKKKDNIVQEGGKCPYCGEIGILDKGRMEGSGYNKFNEDKKHGHRIYPYKDEWKVLCPIKFNEWYEERIEE